MNILSRLNALENRPGSKIPHFSVELADGTTQTAHGFGLLTVDDVRVVRYDPRQECAATVIELFAVLHPCAEVVADGVY